MQAVIPRLATLALPWIQQAERAADPGAEDIVRLCVETLDVRSLREPEKVALIEAASSWLGRDDLRELVDQALRRRPGGRDRRRSALMEVVGPGGADRTGAHRSISTSFAATYGPPTPSACST